MLYQLLFLSILGVSYVCLLMSNEKLFKYLFNFILIPMCIFGVCFGLITFQIINIVFFISLIVVCFLIIKYIIKNRI